jgi:hypothetical protein
MAFQQDILVQQIASAPRRRLEGGESSRHPGTGKRDKRVHESGSSLIALCNRWLSSGSFRFPSVSIFFSATRALSTSPFNARPGRRGKPTSLVKFISCLKLSLVKLLLQVFDRHFVVADLTQKFKRRTECRHQQVCSADSGRVSNSFPPTALC